MPVIKHKRMVKSRWTATNPILADGELGFELNTNSFKIGNGLTPWNELPYFCDSTIFETGRLSKTSMQNEFQKAAKAGVGINVQAFGAVGDGVTDDTEAIQDAVNALDAHGGAVVMPAGTYLITDSIKARSALRVYGENNSSTVLYQVTPNCHGIEGTDILTLDLENFRVTGPGASSGNGIGIMLERNAHHATNYVSIRNIYVRTFGRSGVYASNMIVSNFSTVISEDNGVAGFELSGLEGVIGTSTTMQNCFANANGESGYRIDTMGYMSLLGCAADHNEVSYDLRQCIGVTLNGCGSEGSTNTAFKMAGGYGNTIIGGWVYAHSGIGVHVTEGSIGATVMTISETGPEEDATAFVKVDLGCKATLLNVHNSTPNVVYPGTTQIINDVAGNGVLNGHLDVQGGITLNGVPLNTTRGSRWFLSNSEHLDAADVPNPIAGDIFMYGNSGDLFNYNGSTWVYSGTLSI